jgi:putative transposase
MKVNRSYYYAVVNNQKLTANDTVEPLKKRLIALFHQHNQNYGSRRLANALREESFQIGRYRVRKLMKTGELFVQQKLRYKNTTDSAHELKVCDNLLDRKFSVEAANQV